jgi:hypothetical protein
MSQQHDYDLRQFSRMMQVIDEFLIDKVSLRELVSTLSFLLTNLEEVSGEWRHNFQEQWEHLEMINADIREQERSLTEAESEFILERAKQLKDLVKKVIQ